MFLESFILSAFLLEDLFYLWRFWCGWGWKVSGEVVEGIYFEII